MFIHQRAQCGERPAGLRAGLPATGLLDRAAFFFTFFGREADPALAFAGTLTFAGIGVRAAVVLSLAAADTPAMHVIVRDDLGGKRSEGCVLARPAAAIAKMQHRKVFIVCHLIHFSILLLCYSFAEEKATE